MYGTHSVPYLLCVPSGGNVGYAVRTYGCNVGYAVSTYGGNVGYAVRTYGCNVGYAVSTYGGLSVWYAQRTLPTAQIIINTKGDAE